MYVSLQGFKEMPNAQEVLLPDQPYNYLKKVSLCCVAVEPWHLLGMPEHLLCGRNLPCSAALEST